MKEKLYQHLIELTNGKQSSHLLQTIAKAKWSKRIIPSYMKVYDINLEEVSKKQNNFQVYMIFLQENSWKKHAQLHKIRLHLQVQ